MMRTIKCIRRKRGVRLKEADAAVNVDSLVQSMSTVNGQMEENSTAARNLKEESAAFANV